jgi:Bifunctional DNA primase/polymerase, N-terminal
VGNLEFALWYLDRFGFAIIPIAAGTKKPPRGFAWKAYQTAQPTVAQLRKWFGNGRGHGMAVVLGEASGGLVCRDFDDMVAYDRWAARFPHLAKSLPTVETGRPGRHVYCRCDVAQIRAASETGAGIIDLGDGEVRGTGGYCLLPPSRHPLGHSYRFVVPLTNGIPFLDLHTCGFLTGDETESNREGRENRGPLKTTEAIRLVADESRQPLKMASVDLRSTGGLSDAIESAVTESLPSTPRQRNRCVFEFARALKAIPELASTEARTLEPIVRDWHRRALPFISTKPFEETWIDFLRAWPRVQHPKGSDPMAAIFAKALKADVPNVVDEKGYQQAALRLLVSLCRELQRAAGDRPFYLSARTAGRLLGVDHLMAWRWLFLLEQDNILRVVTRGDQKTWKASRYRYVAESKD